MKLNERPVWRKLENLSKNKINIAEQIASNPNRASDYSIEQQGLYFNYAKSLVDDEILTVLKDLANESGLLSMIEAMFNGGEINVTEQRSVLHTALRSTTTKIVVNGQDLRHDIEAELQKAKQFTNQLRYGEICGYSGKTITDVINIGIGGSDLGPKMVTQALSEFQHDDLNIHFISNVDGACINQLLKQLNHQTTLVIIQSKTFTTIETLTNAQVAIDWFAQHGVQWSKASEQFVAVTANAEKAMNFGISNDNLFCFWDWVGGRYSLWSVIGLPIMISIGYERFIQLLQGAEAMDTHFRQTDLSNNMPVIAGLIGIWYRNFMNMGSYAILPYCQRLFNLPAYIQQLDMESNGKSVTVDNSDCEWQTGAVIWGQPGTDGQHAFHQLLHQGTDIIPIDFIASKNDNLSNDKQHRLLLENMLAQSAALMQGRQAAEPYRSYQGNRPSNILIIDELNPYNLGQIIAFYEHKVFVQGVIWQINSFDQWGVELGKEMANSLASNAENVSFDASTKLLQQRLF